MVRDHPRLAQEQACPKAPQTNVVLKKHIAPPDMAEKLTYRGLAHDLKWPFAGVTCSRAGDHSDLMSTSHKLHREQRGDSFDSTKLRPKAVGGQQNFQSKSAVIQQPGRTNRRVILTLKFRSRLEHSFRNGVKHCALTLLWRGGGNMMGSEPFDSFDHFHRPVNFPMVFDCKGIHPRRIRGMGTPTHP